MSHLKKTSITFPWLSSGQRQLYHVPGHIVPQGKKKAEPTRLFKKHLDCLRHLDFAAGPDSLSAALSLLFV